MRLLHSMTEPKKGRKAPPPSALFRTLLQWLHGIVRLHAEGQTVFGGINDHPLIVAHLPADDELGERRFNVGLQVPLERAGPIVRIIGGIPDELVGGLGQFQRNPMTQPFRGARSTLSEQLWSLFFSFS